MGRILPKHQPNSRGAGNRRRARSPITAKSISKVVTHQQGVTDVTVQAPSGQQRPDVSGPEAQRTRRWNRTARQGNAAQAENLTLSAAPSHHPETREMDRPRASPARTSLRVRSPGGPWPWGHPLACAESLGQDPCRLWWGRHSNRESHASPAVSSRGQGQLSPPNRTWN